MSFEQGEHKKAKDITRAGILVRLFLLHKILMFLVIVRGITI